MTKEEKLVVINAIAEQLQAYPHFYIADIAALDAEQTAALRRKCFENDVKLVVVKNTLLGKALEKVEKADADLVKVLEGPTSIMFANVAKAPAVLIKEFRKKSDKPVLKAAFAEGCADRWRSRASGSCSGRPAPASPKRRSGTNSPVSDPKTLSLRGHSCRNRRRRAS